MYSVSLSQHLEKLPAFLTVSRLGSITKAAKVLAVSQAALSQSMKTLEDSLDLALLVRSRKGVSLTEEGAVLHRYCEQLAENLDRVETQLRNPTRPEVERIRIGTHETLAIHLWPEVLETFQSQNPNSSLSILSGRVDPLVQQVLNDSLDLIVTVKPKGAKGLVSTPLYQDDLEFYAPKVTKASHSISLLNKTRLSFSDLSKIPILTDRQAHLAEGRSISQSLTEVGLHGAYYFQLNSFEAAAQFASRGLGIALLPTKIAATANKNLGLRKVTVTDLPKHCFRHTLYYSHRAPAPAKQGVRKLIAYLTLE